VPTIRTWTASIETMLLGALAGGSVATLAPGGGLLRLAVVAALGAILGSRLSGDGGWSAPTAAPAILRHVPWLGLIFLLPVLTLPVAPGADMAMHVALARALREGSRTLSPAWGAVEVSAYPRGFSAWVALLSPLLGYAKAGLLVACASYLLYQLALQRLFEALSVPLAAPLAVLCLFIAKVPQSFFTWGGNPTAFAAALALLAVAELVRRGAERPLRTAAFAAVLLAGAAAAHPMGACVGVLSLAAIPLLPRLRTLRMLLAVALGLLGLAGAFLWLRLGGPSLSPREAAWIFENQHTTEALAPGSPLLWPLRVFLALPWLLGPAYVITLGVAVLLELASPVGRRRVALAAGGMSLLAGLLAVGPRLPLLGILFNPARFTPLLVLAGAPLIAHAASGLFAARPRIGFSAASLALVAALSVRAYVTGHAVPIATENDVESLRCIAATVPTDALIDGPYGDATQWIPALSGRAITRPHEHCTLFDEIDAALPAKKPTHRFVGERLRYGNPLPGPPPQTQPICQKGRAALYALP